MLVRQATLEDLDQMTALIHATTKKLIEKNVFQWAYPCELESLASQLKNGEVYILEDHNRLIGSYSIKEVEDNFPVQIEKSLYMYRMIVHPFYQGKNMTHFMFKHIKKEHKKNHVLLDCWAGNEKLSKFYIDNDCLFLGDYPEKDYKISVFQVGKRGNIVRDNKGYFKKL